MEICPLRAAVLMCHAPIVIPVIGGERAQGCAVTTAAMQAAALALIQSGAETVLVVSPHTPRHRQAFGYVAGETLRGDFRAFGLSNQVAAFRADTAAAAAVVGQAHKVGLPMAPSSIPCLDHGALVPLWFLQQAGFRGRVAVFSFPWARAPGDAHRFGEVLAFAMNDVEEPWALVASGDMSHALKPGAPAGFHPLAHSFDETVVTCLQEGRIGAVGSIDPHLRTLAAEDVVESLAVADGTLGTDHSGMRVLSYEAPFGVGYLIAILRGPANRGSANRKASS